MDFMWPSMNLEVICRRTWILEKVKLLSNFFAWQIVVHVYLPDIFSEIRSACLSLMLFKYAKQLFLFSAMVHDIRARDEDGG